MKLLCGTPIWSDGFAVDRDACEEHLDEGEGNTNLTRYYFNTNKCDCEEFTYKGTGGNDNNFETMEACNTKCHNWDIPGNHIHSSHSISVVTLDEW